MSFLRGALALTLAGLLTKIIGAVYRVPLTYLLGAEGIGLYQMAYPIYGMAYILSASGIPIAVAKLVAEEGARGRPQMGRKIFRVAFGLLLVTGLVSSILFYQAAPHIATLILGDSRAMYPLRFIAPAVFFVATLAALKGYFQGSQRMIPIGVSQVVEQLVRVSTMLALAYFLLPKGLEYAAAGATFGAVTGALVGNVVLGTIYARSPRPVGRGGVQEKSTRAITKDIVRLALPVTFGAFIMPVMETIDAAIVPLRLQAVGFGVREATALYGQLAGMAVTLIAFPTVITAAFAFSLVPAISEALASGKHDVISQRVKEALKLTVLVALPATVGLYILPEEICLLLFRTPEAGIPLGFLAYGCFFLCLQQTSSGVLQGLGRTTIPVQSILLGGICNAFLNYYLTAIPFLNIRGAALGTGFGYTVAALFNLLAIRKHTGINISFREYLLAPLIAVIGMAVAVKFSHQWLWAATQGSPVTTLLAIGIGAAVYIPLAVVTGALPLRYLSFIPFNFWKKG